MAENPKNESNEINLIRIYDAPVRAVWGAWTDPAQTAQWWGPRGWSITTHSKDLRVGGHWSYTMHGPNGEEIPNKTIYLEVDEGKRLVYDHGGNDDRPPMFRVTVLFSEMKGGKTKMDMTMRLPTAEALRDTHEIIKRAGGNTTWDRLAEHLSPAKVFVINRAFDAPLERMFDMWSRPEHLSKWLPPTGFDMRVLSGEIAEGAHVLYEMSNGAMKLRGRIHYQTIERPDRMVYSQEFVDEQGHISRHPGLPVWPASMQSVVTFSAEGADRTRVTVEWQPGAAATAEEIAVFEQQRGGMSQGWTGSFDKLEAILG